MTPARTAAARAEPRRSGMPLPARSRRARSNPRPGRPPRQGARLRVASATRTSRLPFLIASFVVVGLLVVGVASLQAVVSQGSFRMQDLTRRNVELQQVYGRLKLQVAELSSPGRIAAKARRLGFHLPQPGDVRTLRVKGTTRMSTGAGTLNGPALSLKTLMDRRP